MRTTLTLDDDVAAMLKRLQKKRGSGLKEVVNEALREGLTRLERVDESPKTVYCVKPLPIGRALVDNFDNIEEVLEQVDGAWRT